MANFLSDALDIGNTDLYDKAKENKHDQVESLQFSKHEGTESEPKSFTNIPYDKIGVIDSAIDDKESISRIPGSLSIEDYDKKYNEIDSVKKLNRVEGKESEPSTLLLGKLQSIDEFYANANKNTPEKKAAFIKSIEEFYKQQTGYPVVPIQVTQTIDEFYEKNVGNFKEALPYEYAEALNRQMEDIMMTISIDKDYDEKKVFDEISSRYNSMISEMQTAGILSPEVVEKFKIGSDDVRNESLALIHKYVEALHEVTNTTSDNNAKGEFNNIQTDGTGSVGPDFDKYSSAESKLNTKSQAKGAVEFSDINNDKKTTLPPDFDKYNSAETKLDGKSKSGSSDFNDIKGTKADFNSYDKTATQVSIDPSSKNLSSDAFNSFADIDDVAKKASTHGEVPDSIKTEYDDKSVQRKPLAKTSIDDDKTFAIKGLNQLDDNNPTLDKLASYKGNNSTFNPTSQDTKESTFLKDVADIDLGRDRKENRDSYDNSAIQAERLFTPDNINALNEKIIDIRNSVASTNTAEPFISFTEMYMEYYIDNQLRKLDKSLTGEHFNENKDEYKGELETLEFSAAEPSSFKKNFWYYYSQVNTMNAISLISSTTDRLLDALKEKTGANWLPGWANGKNVSNVLNTAKQMGVVPDGLRRAENMIETWASMADIVAKLYQNKDKLTFENLTFATTYMYFETPLLPHIDVHTDKEERFGQNSYGILGYEVQTGFMNGLKKYGKNLVKGVTGLFGYDPFSEGSNDRQAGEDKGWGAEHFIAELYKTYYDNDDYYYAPLLSYRLPTDYNYDDNNVKGSTFNMYTFETIRSKNAPALLKADGSKSATSYEKLDPDKTLTKRIREIEVSELATELVFKGRDSIKNYTLFDQFKWDLKLERIEGVTNGSDGTNTESSKYRVPLLSEFMNEGNAVKNKGESWLPVSDFNINFSDMDMATIPLFQGMNLPMPEKLSFPLNGSMTFLENANLAVTSWLHAYKRTIFAGTGGYLTMPYQRCALKLSIYFWEWVSSKKSLRIINSMIPHTLSDDTREFIKKYVLYIIPTNIPDNLVGSSSPSPLTITMNFSIVGAESGYMVDLNEAKRLYTTEMDGTDRSVGNGDYVKQKIQMKNASSNNINASLYQPGVDKAKVQADKYKAAQIEAAKAAETKSNYSGGGRGRSR